MKKFLLTLGVAALAASSMQAADVTLSLNDATGFTGTWKEASGNTAAHWEPCGDFTIGNYKLSATSSDEKATQPAYYLKTETKDATLRLYISSSLTITAPAGEKIAQVVFNCASLKGVDSNIGDLPLTVDGKNLTWTTETPAETVTINLPTTKGTSSNPNVQINTITLSSEVGENPGGDDDDTKNPTEVNNVADLLKLSSGDKIKVNFDIVVAYANASCAFGVDAIGDPIQLYFSNSFKANDIIAGGWEAEYKLYGTTPEIVSPVAAPTVSATGSYTYPEVAPAAITTDMVNKAILVKSVTFAAATPADKTNFTGTAAGTDLTFRNNFTIASAAAGTYDVKAIVAVYNNAVQLYPVEYVGAEEPGPGPEPTVTEVNSIGQIMGLVSGSLVKVNFPLTVAYVNGNNVFCVDGDDSAIQLYGANSYQVNDVLATGWEATYDLYQGTTPELKNFTAPEATPTGTFQPAEVYGVSVDDVNSVVILKDVTFAAATPSTKDNFTGTVDGTEYAFRNNYTIPGVEAGTYDVKCVVTVFNAAPSLYVIEYVSGTGVGTIDAEGAAAVYYDLNGRTVKGNLDKGLYIRVANGKAQKVIVK